MGTLAHAVVGMLPDVLARPLTDTAGRRPVGRAARGVKPVRRGGTVSVSGVYGGEVDPLPMMEMFDRGSRCGWGSAT